MLAAVRSAAVLGVEAFDVTVEVDCTRGLPQWIIVGMPASSVKESRERVAAALGNAGITLPQRKITCNLAPADVAKTGTAFDLPIAVAVLVAFGIVPEDKVRDELVHSKQQLEAMLGRPVEIFAYPYNSVRRWMPPLVLEAGYRAAVAGSAHGTADRFALYRIGVYAGTASEALLAQLPKRPAAVPSRTALPQPR